MDETNQDQHAVRSVTLPDGKVIPLPEQFASMKLTKSGQPDKRDAQYAEFMAWVNEADAQALVRDSVAVYEDPLVQAAVTVFSAGEAVMWSCDPTFADSAAQAYAERIFKGQSPDLSMNDRLARVKAGLEAQGMSMDGVVL